MKGPAVAWAAASVAAHVVALVLLAMSRLARPAEGELRPGGLPDPEGPAAVVRLDTPPDFIEPRRFEGPFLPPPTTELPFDRGWTQRIDCTIDDRPKEAPPVHDPLRLARIRVSPPGGNPGEGAVLAALRWLARHQGPDGAWKPTLDCGRCLPSPGNDDHRVGVTALALLAFVRAGHTTGSSAVYDGISFAEVVRSARHALRTAQDAEGCIGPYRDGKFMYDHALATLALAESANPCLPDPAVRRATDFLLVAQNPGLGWRYSVRPGENDTSVTTWAVLALLAAEKNTEERYDYRGPRAWYDSVTEEAYGRAGYTHRGPRRWGIPWPNENFDHHETLTAMSAVVRKRLEGSNAPEYCALDLLHRDRPLWDANLIDFTYWHFGTLAMVEIDPPNGKRRKAWKEDTLRAILPNQRTLAHGCRNGSWDPVDKWSAEGGRVYATAMNAMTLRMLSD